MKPSVACERARNGQIGNARSLGRTESAKLCGGFQLCELVEAVEGVGADVDLIDTIEESELTEVEGDSHRSAEAGQVDAEET